MRCKIVSAICQWRSLTLLAAATFAVFLLLPGGIVTGAIATDSGPAIVRVEEDWKLVLNEPEAEINAPQFHTAMSPYANADREYAQVLWNYRELPEFEAGGLQLELWRGEDDLVRRGVGDQSLSRDAETITWTQRLDAGDGALRFQVLPPQQNSWVTFRGSASPVRRSAAGNRANPSFVGFLLAALILSAGLARAGRRSPVRGKKPQEGVWGNLRRRFPQVSTHKFCGRTQVLNGRSLSWGSFGGDGMAVAVSAGVPNLNAYSPSVSKGNSAITFGANRVNMLVITEVRRYSAAGLVSADRAQLVVYQAPVAE